MKLKYYIALLLGSIILPAQAETGQLRKAETLRYALLVNNYFMAKYPDVGANSYVGGKERNSRIWTRGVYYEGLMALHRQHQDETILKYAEDWGNFHQWISATGSARRHADFQCCGQAYIDMYLLRPDLTIRKAHIKSIIDEMLASSKIDDWYWIDAIQMAMPVFAQLGSIEQDDRYFERMYEMYMYTRNKHGGSQKGGGNPLFNTSDGLWYRDYQYDPPYTDLTETDKPCYWSRGNGWVYEALARVLHYAPGNAPHRDQYISDFTAMSAALKACQRSDGFWGVSLAAPGNTGSPASPGPETSGTALFTAGMAYGINAGILDRETYLPTVIKAWNAMCSTAVHDDGFLGYVQGAGAKPEDGQPVTFTNTPDFEDFGTGCFLLAAAEVYRLGDVDDLSGIDDPNEKPAIGFNYFIRDKQLIIVLKSTCTENIDFRLFDTGGRLVYHYETRIMPENEAEFSIPVNSGIFIGRITTSGQTISEKIML